MGKESANKDALLHRCEPSSRATPGTPVERSTGLTVDIHCHLLTPSVEKLVAGHPDKLAQAQAEAEALGPDSVRYNQGMFGALLPKLVEIDQRLRDMDAMGVDIQAISTSPIQYYYWAQPDLAEQIVDEQNEAVLSHCDAHPDRFVGLGTVAMQHPDMAAQQLASLMDDGMKGVQISTLVNGLDIADRYFDPFWQKADELGAVVFIHPWGSTLGARLSQFYLANTVGQPLETTICLSKLIFGGTLDRHKRLKIVAAHGGGYLPFYSGRSDHAHAVRPEAGDCGCSPSKALRRIWYDSIVYEPQSLSRLVDLVGSDRILLGSDYPFDMGDYDPMRLVSLLDSNTQRKILGQNAVELLGLKATDRSISSNG